MRVTLHQVGHRFGTGAYLFWNLSRTLLPGRSYAVVGPSGSGKSTLLSLLAGWLVPTVGTIERDGVQRAVWVLQNPYGSPRRTALDQVSLPLLAAGARRDEADRAARSLLQRVGLAEVADRPMQTLSGGEAQRLVLARGVAAAPQLLLVDEPTAQLDRRTADTVNRSLARLVTEGLIIVVATHDVRTRDACAEVIDLSGTG